MLKHNFVHADLHPGNILVGSPALGSDAPLTLSFVDAGLAVELSERDRRNFALLFRALGMAHDVRPLTSDEWAAATPIFTKLTRAAVPS